MEPSSSRQTRQTESPLSIAPLAYMVERLLNAYKTVRADLLSACAPPGHWKGELSSSALATATAISALVTCEQEMQRKKCLDEDAAAKIRLLILAGLHHLATQQNEDGGWGDTDRSKSNIAATMLIRAAFQMTGVPAHPENMLPRADEYIRQHGGIRGLRHRYGRDKTFAVPILANCALAGLIPWRRVPALPFELSCLPQWTHRLLRLPVVSYAIPALVAIGIVRFSHAPPLNPIFRYLRKKLADRAIQRIETMQPASGGFLEAVPLTSFIAMGLASAGYADHPIVKAALRFLMHSVRTDGSWPIDSNLSVWVTSLSVNALAVDGENLDELDCEEWLLKQQHLQKHPYTGASPGGWAWTDLSGGVPDADDTAGVLLALSAIGRRHVSLKGTPMSEQISTAVTAGIDWLLNVQNDDGGWPTFCRGWGKLPFDRSGSDLTAHAIRALYAWYKHFDSIEGRPTLDRELRARNILTAIERGLEFLKLAQCDDGSWVPLWFGNESQQDQTNPFYGTARVLMAYRDIGKVQSEQALSGFKWLLAAQDIGGGWGGSGRHITKGSPHRSSSIEETALAIEALLSHPEFDSDPSVQHMVHKGLAWLTDAIERNSHEIASPIGLYFAKLWYYERLYPLVFATSALARAIQAFSPHLEPQYGTARDRISDAAPT
ncbi:MAG: prenyltransferase/squalene oxidase repeat-containing protein [Pirellulales bacterium]|nr:prenyltransferase/squalene oxidase repeat-containing protein [Pirellulales bacterium]HJN66469.1 prenyltransferase/squalene oxidase repeat-containing protein [Pirellulales bacterium]